MDPVDDMHHRRDRVRDEMGGVERLKALADAGQRNVRERISALVDPGSFTEIGTFAASLDPAQRADTPGDGKIGGHARINGRPVSVAGDDITVRRASSSAIGTRKINRIYEQALRAGQPLVYLGQTGGARIPDTLGSEGFSLVSAPVDLAQRRHRIPLATAIVGESFGGSSFIAGLSDFVVQVDGSCLAVTAPRVIEAATGERISMEDLGGTRVHSDVTGQVDLTVATEDEGFTAIRRFLSYLPSNAWTAAPRGQRVPVEPDGALAAIVPSDRKRAYDMKAVIGRVADPDSFFELQPRFARSLITGLARIDGLPIGVIASQPKFQAGTLTPEACDKAARLLVLCDSFDIPVVILQDTPGFLVGSRVEHGGLLRRSMRFLEALALCGSPRLTVVIRKAFGMAYFSLGGNGTGSDLLVAWPGAEIGFMDPKVGANVLHAAELAQLEPGDREDKHEELAAAMTAATDPYPLAETMKIDEIIDPGSTRVVLANALNSLTNREPRPPDTRPLAAWYGF